MYECVCDCDDGTVCIYTLMFFALYCLLGVRVKAFYFSPSSLFSRIQIAHV